VFINTHFYTFGNNLGSGAYERGLFTLINFPLTLEVLENNINILI